jgi:hypothetical protein
VDKSQKIRKRQQRPGLLRGLFKKFACSELIRDTKRRNLRRGLQLRIDNGWDPTGKAQIERIVQCAESANRYSQLALAHRFAIDYDQL